MNTKTREDNINRSSTSKAPATTISVVTTAPIDIVRTTNPSTNNGSQETEVLPIVLSNKNDWIKLSNTLKTERINFTKAEAIEGGIRFRPASVENFRRSINSLDNLGMEYHTYRLPDEKQLHIVLRGIPECIQKVTEDPLAN